MRGPFSTHSAHRRLQRTHGPFLTHGQNGGIYPGMTPAPPPLPPLPIDAVLPELVAALTRYPAVVLQAPPGAGKTTRVPGALLDAGLAGDGQILLLEPRRVAARAAAQTLARQRGEPLGETVGY